MFYDKMAGYIFVFCLLFSVALFPWVMGRVDDGVSRFYPLSLLISVFMLPLGLFLYSKIKLIPIVFYFGMGLLIGVVMGKPITLEGYVFKSMDVTKSDQLHWVDGDKVGLSVLGKGLFDIEVLDHLLKLNQFVSLYLPAGEDFFDFTNRQSSYVLLNLKVPGGMASDYTAFNQVLQQGIIDRLEKKPPAMAWIEPRLHYDGASLSLRCYRVYRWFILNGYEGVEYGKLRFFIRKDLMHHFPAWQSRSFSKEWVDRLKPSDIGKIPQAWGRSATVLSRFDSLNIEVAKSPGVLVMKQPIRGSDMDFLEIVLPDEIKGEYRLGIGWSDDGGSCSPNSFVWMKASAGRTLIVPMGIDPNWLRSSSISKICLIREDNEHFSGISALSVRGLHLVR